MKNFFSRDSKFTIFFQNIADLMILNILTIIFSLPIITIGASYTAMHYVLTKWEDENRSIGDFFKAWKNNFRQATCMWIIFLGVFGIIFYDLFLIKNFYMNTNTMYVYVMIAIMILLLFTMTWTFILQSRYENTIIRTIKNSIIIGFIQLKYTLLIALLYALPIIIVYLFPPMLPTVFLLGIATAGYFQKKFYLKVFDKIENMNDES